MRWAYVEAPAGVSGDMFLGALVDLGWPLGALEALATGLGVDGLGVRSRRVERGGLAATKVDVAYGARPVDGADGHAGPHAHTFAHETGDGHRSLADVRADLARLGTLDEAPRRRAAETFRLLAEAEAAVHGSTPERVHFHEVGALDALVDVAGTCAGFHDLGVEHIAVGPLPWARGTVRCSHGTMPNPAPATVELFRGHPTVPSEATYEQVTPTGAALVRALASATAPPPGFVPARVGLGAGSHPGEDVPNVLRVTVGEVLATPPSDEVVLLETNLDDVTGQVVAHAVERSLAAGALDVWWTPVTMKKGRPGVVLSVLVGQAQRATLERVLFRETPTLGIRAHHVTRTVLARRLVRVDTPWGPVRVKVRETPDGPACTPEYEDCRQLALAQDVPLARVLAAARDAARA